MHHLPFDSALSPVLYGYLKQHTDICQTDEPDMLPSIDWCRWTTGEYWWGVQWFSRRFMQAEDIVNVDGLEIHFERQERTLLQGKALHIAKVDGSLRLTEVPLA